MRNWALLTSILFVGVAAAPSSGYHVAQSVALPDGGWDYASFDAKSGQVLVARGTSVDVVDVAHGNSVRTIGSIQRGHAVLPLPDGKRVLVTSGNDASVRILDIASGSELARIAVGKKPDAATLDPITGHALVMNAGEGSVAVIDTNAAKLVKTIPSKAGLEAAVVAGNRKLYVNDEDANEVEVIDLDKEVAGTPIALAGCEGPSGIGYDAKTDRIVSACANGKAAIIDPSQGKLVGLVDIGRGPDTVLIDAAHNVALIPCGRDGVLDVIALNDLGGARHVARFTTEVGARTGAIDPATGTVYLPTARFNPPAQPGARPTMVPGSAHLLVVRRS